MYANDGSHTRMQKRWWGCKSGVTPPAVDYPSLWSFGMSLRWDNYAPHFFNQMWGYNYRKVGQYQLIDYSPQIMDLFKLYAQNMRAGYNGGDWGVTPGIYTVDLEWFVMPTDRFYVQSSSAIIRYKLNYFDPPDEFLADITPVSILSTGTTYLCPHRAQYNQGYMFAYGLIDTVMESDGTTGFTLRSVRPGVTTATQEANDFIYPVTPQDTTTQTLAVRERASGFTWKSTTCGSANYTKTLTYDDNGHISKMTYRAPFAYKIVDMGNSLTLRSSDGNTYTGAYVLRLISNVKQGNSFNVTNHAPTNIDMERGSPSLTYANRYSPYITVVLPPDYPVKTVGPDNPLYYAALGEGDVGAGGYEIHPDLTAPLVTSPMLWSRARLIEKEAI